MPRKSYFKLISICVLGFIFLLISGLMQTVQGMNVSVHDDTTQVGKHHKDMKSMVHDMHTDMMGIKMTGDPDADFAHMMIKHHKGAVKISENVIENGKDSEIKSMAEKVKDSQQKDIEELEAFTSEDHAAHHTDEEMTDEETAGTDAQEQMFGSMENEMMKPMEDMVGDVDKMEMTGNNDKDYASMIIMHHNAAIDMAEEYLEKGQNEKLKRMAERMIKDNKNDIEKFEDWQTRHE